MKQRTTRIMLTALIATFLVPYGWIAERSPVIGQHFYAVFRSLAAHMIGHALIFAMVGLMTLRALPGLRGRPAIYAALILCVALAQEGFQMLYKGLVIDDTMFDITIDLLAAAGAWASWDEGARQL